MLAMSGRISFKPTPFWDKIAEKYYRQPIGDQAAYRHKLEVTRSFLSPDFEVLEIGCGTGSTAIRHAPFVTHIRATDSSETMIDIGRRQATEAGVSNVTFQRASIDQIEAPLGPVDVVMAMSLVHLLDDWRGGLARIYDLVKPGGSFISSTVCADGGKRFLKPVVPLMRALGLAPDVSFIKSNDLRQALLDVGFEIEVDWQPKRNAALFLVAKKPAWRTCLEKKTNRSPSQN